MPTHHRKKKKNKLSKKIGGGGEKKSALYKIVVIGWEFIKTRKNPNLKITEPYLT